ncbi:MAG: hypothetical protein ACRDZY_10960 [Acidimicrobiales bacterium]
MATESPTLAAAGGGGGSRRGPVSRRVFLRNGTLGATVLGMVASVPGLAGLLGGASSEAPAVTGAATDAEAAAPELSGPIVAHVTNAATGDVSLYVGEREIPYRDPTLVQHLLRAAR